MMERKELDEKLRNGGAGLSYLRDNLHKSVFGGENVWLGTDISLELKDFSLFHIEELTFEEKAPRREAMENILGTFRGMKGISFIYLILGDTDGVNFYFGVARDYSYGYQPDFDAVDLGRDILAPSIRGNFRGSEVREIGGIEGDNAKKAAILARLKECAAAGCLLGVPGTAEDNEGFQGVDRLIDVMAGERFGFMLIARPYSEQRVDALEQSLLAVSDALAPLARYTLQRSHSEATSTHEGESSTRSRQSGKTMQASETVADSKTNNKSYDRRSDQSNQTQSSTNNSATEQFGRNMNVDKSHSHTDNSNSRDSDSNGDSWGNSTNENQSVQAQVMDAYSYSVIKGEITSDSKAKTDSTSHSIQKSFSESFSGNKSHDESQTQNDSYTSTEQVEVEAKLAAEWLKYIDDVLLPRLDYGRGKGLFLSCAYIFADEPTMLYRLANNAISLYSGPKGNRAALVFHSFGKEDIECCRLMQNMQIPVVERQKWLDDICPSVLSQDLPEKRFFIGSWLSAQDLSIFASLPQKEVPGLALREEVDFGLNINTGEAPIPQEERIALGKLVQNGIKRDLSVYLDKRVLNKHTFVTGVTGSGKTTTCQRILTNWGWGEKERPFLVIEPAKTEYRIMKDKDVIFFTPGLQDVAPFYLNPFELFKGEKITARADMLKATFTAAFEMEAAIPQILETSIYRAYEEKGWDVQTNRWNRLEENDPNGAFADGVYAFPTLSDFLQAIIKVTESEGFDSRLKNDYIGSIKARIESLMVGAKGMMLNTARSIDFGDLINRHVVIELEEIKSGEEKTLLMGFILTNLLQAIKIRHREDNDFRHITLVEEAHRLLSRYEPGDGMSRKQGVGVFADMLAEVRKYGESLIIADQIPEKMTPEVLKNTNTKIVHKLFAKDDKESIGDTMALDDDQKAFLSKLPTGRAVMLSQGWSKAIQIEVDKITDTDGKEVPLKDITDISVKYYTEEKVWQRGILRGSEHVGNRSEETTRKYLWLLMNGGHLLRIYQAIASDPMPPSDMKWNEFTDEIKRIRKDVDDSMWQTYLYCNSYEKYDGDKEKIFKNMFNDIVQGTKSRDELFHGVIRKYLKLRSE